MIFLLLLWNAVTTDALGNLEGPVAYRVESRLRGAETWAVAGLTTETQFSACPLQEYRVFALDAAGNVSDPSGSATGALSGMVLSWNPPVGCEPQKPLALPIHHDVRFSVRRVLGLEPCPTEENPEATCTVYNPFSWTGDSTFCEALDTGEADVAPGEVLTFEVTDVDALGRKDCGVTP